MYARYLFFFIIFPLVIFVGEYLIFLLFNQLDLFKYLYVKNIFIVLGITLPLFFIISMSYGVKHFSVINSWFYTIGGIGLSILNYLLIITFIVSLLLLISSQFNLNIPLKQITIILSLFVLVITVYGIYKSSNPKTVTMEITSPVLAPLWKDKKIMIISDVHIGETRREKFVKKIVDIINAEKPDIVFNLGDLIDGQSFPYKEGFAPFSELNPTLGNYYVEGNHEGYSQEYSKFKENFPKNINDVTSKKMIVNGTQIIGIPFSMERNSEVINKELESVSYDKTTPSIVLLHDPKEVPVLADNNVSLVLSGHTHEGQFFPFNLVVKAIYGKYSHGVAYTKETASLTSSGVGTAVSPMRIGTDSEIVILHIK